MLVNPFTSEMTQYQCVKKMESELNSGSGTQFQDLLFKSS